ncbi:hypothetical protein [Arthrobacter sp. B2a2-09]|nr:hypothetical protein [Arthrobacter sp. B2a2-09]MCZ9883542.1 hypothetical protein [Arthrobacter sp. B2a2-09]
MAIGAGRGVYPAGLAPALVGPTGATTYDLGLIELEYKVRTTSKSIAP